MTVDAALAFVRTTLPDGGRVLDAGCGDGALTVALVDAGYTAVGVDRDLDVLRPVADAHPRIPFFLDDLTAPELPFAVVGRGFDVVVLQDVVGAMGLADLDATLSTCASFATADGWLAVSVPEGSVGTVARTAAKAGWHEDRRETWDGVDGTVLVLRREAARKPSRLRSLLGR